MALDRLLDSDGDVLGVFEAALLVELHANGAV